MTSEEAMALAVLKGDTTAARALADILSEKYSLGGIDIRSTMKIADTNKIRILIYMKNGYPHPPQPVLDMIRTEIERWLRGEQVVMTVTNIDRVEIFEVP